MSASYRVRPASPVACRWVVVAASALCALVSSRSVAAQSAIEGRVVNGTHGADARVGRVNLIRLSEGMSTIESRENVEGTFRFDLTQPGPYMVQVEHEGSTYITRVPPSGGGVASVEITVYDSTTDPSAIRVSIPHLIVIADGGKVSVSKVYDILNPTDPPLAITGSPGAFRFDMPDEAKLVSASVTSVGIPLRQEPTDPGDGPGMTIAQTIKPGRTRYELTYELPYSGSLELSETLYHGADRVSVIVLPDTVEVESEGLIAQGMGERDGIRFHNFSASGLAAGSRLSLTVRGEAVAPKLPGAQDEAGGTPQHEGEVQAVENRFGRGARKFVIPGAAFLLLWIATVVALRRPMVGSGHTAIDGLAAVLIGRIAALDERLAANQLDAADHDEERAHLVARLRAELAQRAGPPRSK